MAQRDREDVASVSFSSQAEAIDYYLAVAQCDPEDVASVSFSSQAEAIDYYLALAQRYGLAAAQTADDALLTANPELNSHIRY